MFKKSSMNHHWNLFFLAIFLLLWKCGSAKKVNVTGTTHLPKLIPPKKCSKTWKYFKGSCYKVMHKPGNFFQSLSGCKALAKPHGLEDHAHLCNLKLVGSALFITDIVNRGRSASYTAIGIGAVFFSRDDWLWDNGNTSFSKFTNATFSYGGHLLPYNGSCGALHKIFIRPQSCLTPFPVTVCQVPAFENQFPTISSTPQPSEKNCSFSHKITKIVRKKSSGSPQENTENTSFPFVEVLFIVFLLVIVYLCVREPPDEDFY